MLSSFLGGRKYIECISFILLGTCIMCISYVCCAVLENRNIMQWLSLCGKYHAFSQYDKLVFVPVIAILFFFFSYSHSYQHLLYTFSERKCTFPAHSSFKMDFFLLHWMYNFVWDIYYLQQDEPIQKVEYYNSVYKACLKSRRSAKL